VDVLHHHLEAIEAASFRSLNFCHEALCQILEDYTVRSGEESKNVLNEVLLVIVQLLPVFDILGKVDFFSGPESGLLVLVHLPDVIEFNGEKHKAVRVLFKKRFLNRSLSLGDNLFRLVRFNRFYSKMETIRGRPLDPNFPKIDHRRGSLEKFTYLL